MEFLCHTCNTYNANSVIWISYVLRENNTLARVYRELLFECSTRYLTRERREQVWFRIQNEKGLGKKNFLSTNNHVLFCLLYEHHRSVLTRKVDFNKERPWIENSERFAIHSTTWQSGKKGEWRVSSWLAISNTRKKLSLLYACAVKAFLKDGNSCNKQNEPVAL